LSEKLLEKTIDSKYIQQHLANERTYLAWIRTALAVVGIGFLVVNMHFTIGASLDFFTDMIVIVIGVYSVIIGTLIIIFATISYYIKKREINEQTFRSDRKMVALLSSFLISLILLFGIYFLFL
jgi:putative membrane protein